MLLQQLVCVKNVQRQSGHNFEIEINFQPYFLFLFSVNHKFSAKKEGLGVNF